VTAPENYIVNPNQGQIDPGSIIEVKIICKLQLDIESILRDRFLVQIAMLPSASNDLSNDAIS
jgi:hypothetical protein